MKLAVLVLVGVGFVGGLSSVVSCSSFVGADDPANAGTDADLTDGDLTADTSSPLDAADASDADPPDFGCPDKGSKIDLSMGTAGFILESGDTKFELLADASEGPIARFAIGTADTPSSDGRYSQIIAPSWSHVCVSARMRTFMLPPSDSQVESLVAFPGTTSTGGYGYASEALRGATRVVGAGYTADPADNPTKKEQEEPSGSGWHVVRLEIDRDDLGPWHATVAVDNKTAFTAAPCSPLNNDGTAVALTDGKVGFGPRTTVHAVAAPSGGVVDYTDLRFIGR